MRGEQGARPGPSIGSAGTPPRAWGAGRLGSLALAVRGNTPTCVGSSRRVECPAGCIPGRGNTPTCVGSSAGGCGHGVPLREHPHVRGEQTPGLRMPSHPPGTPPRAWGAVRPGPALLAQRGNTPTCVGSRTARSARPARAREHPHVRGEQSARPAGLGGGEVDFTYFAKLRHFGHRVSRRAPGPRVLVVRPAMKAVQVALGMVSAAPVGFLESRTGRWVGMPSATSTQEPLSPPL